MESLNELIKTYIHNLSVFYCKKITMDKSLENAIIVLEDNIKNKLK